MIKSVFKEIIIILLLIVAVILLLGILFYDYMPTSKVVPNKVQEYAMSEVTRAEIQKELNNIKSEEIVKTYTIDSSDLEVYEKTNKYNKGKVNPFEQYRVNTQENTSENSTSNSNSANNNKSTSNGNSANNTSSNTTSNQTTNNSSGTFLNTQGK